MANKEDLPKPSSGNPNKDAKKSINESKNNLVDFEFTPPPPAPPPPPATPPPPPTQSGENSGQKDDN